MRHGAERLGIVVLVVSFVLVACGDDDDSGASSPTSEASSDTTVASSTTTTARTTIPATGPVLLESTHYPYALTLPAERLTRPLQSAARPWDGEGRIASDSPYVDRVITSDGVFHIFGIEWDDDLASLAQMFADRQEQTHGCSAEQEHRREVTVAGTPGVGFGQGSCGAENAVFARLALLHDGFGLIAFTSTSPGQESAAIDELTSVLSGLEWRTA